MNRLSGCPIETLKLWSTQVEGEFLEGIRSWKQLTKIELIQTNVTGVQAENVRKWKQWEKHSILP